MTMLIKFIVCFIAGIGAGLGSNPALTAGMIISGAYVGDKFSPLSDTTILSSLGAGSDHLAHTKTQLPYALTVAVITCIGYIIIGICL